MKLFAHPLFIISMLLFLLHQIGQKVLGFHFPLIDAYMDDVVLMPILLFGLLYERRTQFGLGKNYQLKAGEILLATLVVGLIVELIFPMFSDHSTFDYFDFGAYLIGSMIFYLWSVVWPF